MSTYAMTGIHVRLRRDFFTGEFKLDHKPAVQIRSVSAARPISDNSHSSQMVQQYSSPDFPRTGSIHIARNSAPILIQGDIFGYVLPAGKDTVQEEGARRLYRRLSKSGLEVLKELDGSFILAVILDGWFYVFRSVACETTVFIRSLASEILVSSDPLRVQYLDESPRKNVSRGFLSQLITMRHPRQDLGPFDGLSCLHPGELLSANGAEVSVSKIDRLKVDRRSYSSASLDELAHRTRSLLVHSAEHKLSSNRVGVLLSGGLDSSIVAILAGHFAEAVYPIHFTPPKGSPASDVEYAKLVGNTISAELIELEVKSQEDSRSLLDPSFSSRLPYSHISQAPHVNAALKLAEYDATLLATGNLADAAFGPSCHDFFDLKSSLNRLSLQQKAIQVIQTLQLPMPDLRHIVSRSIASKPERAIQIKNKWATTESLELLTADAQKLAAEAWEFALDQDYDLATASALYATQSQVDYFVTNCLLQDVLSPAGLGLANIFASREVLEFGLSVPPFFRAHAHSGRVIIKPLLRSAFIGELPVVVANRVYKAPEEHIYSDYVMSHTDLILDHLNHDSILAEMGLLNADAVAQAIRRPSKAYYLAGALVLAASIEIWLRNLPAEGLTTRVGS
jgi:hypothetical protein